MAGCAPSRVASCGPWGGRAALESELSWDGSHYSISSGILPSLGARSNRRVKLRPFIVSPYDRRYRFFLFFSRRPPRY
jgi:potassium channel